MGEIIIDGVDVSECKFFIENTAPNVDGDEFLEVCENIYTESSYCENNKDCTFKQLKRLQAENEQLKALCDTYFTCYRAKHNDIEGNLFSYRKALEEIREYASAIEKEELIAGYAIRAKSALWRIVKKINEVLE